MTGFRARHASLGLGCRCAFGNGASRAGRLRLAEGEPLSNWALAELVDQTELSPASSASRIGYRRILAGSSSAMPPNQDDNRSSAILRTITQTVFGKALAIDVGRLSFSGRRVTYPRPSLTQVMAIQRVTTSVMEAAGIAPAVLFPQLFALNVVTTCGLRPGRKWAGRVRHSTSLSQTGTA